MNPNELRAWMQFYDENGPRVPTYSGGFGGVFGDAGAAQNEATREGNRLNFALRMAGQQQPSGPQQMPDYFAPRPQNQPPAYTPPTAVAPNPIPGIIGGTAPPPPPQPSGLNYLRELLYGRPRPVTHIIGVRG